MRKLILMLVYGGLAGCAANPPMPVVTPDSPGQATQAVEVAAIAALALKKGDKAQATAAYRTVLELDPGNIVAANNLALLLREQGQFDDAIRLLRAGLEYSPDTAELHYNLAVIAELYLLDLPLALAHYRQYRALTQPKDHQGWEHKAPQDGERVAGWIADLERRLD